MSRPYCTDGLQECEIGGEAVQYLQEATVPTFLPLNDQLGVGGGEKSGP